MNPVIPLNTVTAVMLNLYATGAGFQIILTNFYVIFTSLLLTVMHWCTAKTSNAWCTDNWNRYILPTYTGLGNQLFVQLISFINMYHDFFFRIDICLVDAHLSTWGLSKFKNPSFPLKRLSCSAFCYSLMKLDGSTKKRSGICTEEGTRGDILLRDFLQVWKFPTFASMTKHWHWANPLLLLEISRTQKRKLPTVSAGSCQITGNDLQKMWFRTVSFYVLLWWSCGKYMQRCCCKSRRRRVPVAKILIFAGIHFVGSLSNPLIKHGEEE